MAVLAGTNLPTIRLVTTDDVICNDDKDDLLV